MRIRGHRYDRYKGYFAVILLLLVCCLLFGQDGRNGQAAAGQRETAGFCLRNVFAEEVQERAYQTYLPVLSFVEKESPEGETASFWSDLFGKTLPLYEYTGSIPQSRRQSEVSFLTGMHLPEDQGELLEVEDDLIEAVKRENEDIEYAQESEEERTKASETEFEEAEKTAFIQESDLENFDTLVSGFYAVDSTTYIDREQLNIKKLTEKDMSLKQKDASKPQILIYHTHSQEGFADSVPGDDSTTIMEAGERLAQILQEKYGYNVIHHTGKYDVESRDYAYSNAAPALEKLLQDNPSIEVIIDLHRDEVPPDRRLVTEIDGRKTAQFMFFNGLSRTTRTGEIEYLQNPYLEENLAFSFRMQLVSNEYYPGITRKIYLKGYRYNMHYRGKSLLIELGAQNNTLEEILNACDPLAHVLSLVLSGEE